LIRVFESFKPESGKPLSGFFFSSRGRFRPPPPGCVSENNQPLGTGTATSRLNIGLALRCCLPGVDNQFLTHYEPN
jgi:hypothetical protein